ncbi:MAG: MBL fold metallo-hydrolase [Candidatus Brocadiales bacterium]|jgi:L-ascorbate metabolism protein UlaG (beta-lactamase superfamily)|nr:MBL fold metallo-hydrolase [Candidatus Brocadiales bacterium]
MLELDGITIKWLGHDSMKIKGDKVIYIDPWKLKDTEPADIVLITHDHYDHCSPEDVARVTKKGTVVVGAADVGKKFKKEDFRVVKAGDRVTINGVTVEAVPAYNTNKQFHPRASGWVGYIVTMKGKRIYHAGDTDHIPEMEGMKDIDVALVPVSGTYVMTAEEAAQAVNKMRPKIAVPMHYGDIVGTKADAERFKKLAQVEVRII